MATGTGKTLTALYAVDRLRGARSPMLVVIVAPDVHLVDQWAREIQRFGWGVAHRLSRRDERLDAASRKSD